MKPCGPIWMYSLDQCMGKIVCPCSWYFSSTQAPSSLISSRSKHLGHPMENIIMCIREHTASSAYSTPTSIGLRTRLS